MPYSPPLCQFDKICFDHSICLDALTYLSSEIPLKYVSHIFHIYLNFLVIKSLSELQKLLLGGRRQAAVGLRPFNSMPASGQLRDFLKPFGFYQTWVLSNILLFARRCLSVVGNLLFCSLLFLSKSLMTVSDSLTLLFKKEPPQANRSHRS